MVRSSWLVVAREREADLSGSSVEEVNNVSNLINAKEISPRRQKLTHYIYLLIRDLMDLDLSVRETSDITVSTS